MYVIMLNPKILFMPNIFLLSVRTSSLIMAGYYRGKYTAEIITEDSNKDNTCMKIPRLIGGLMTQHNETIILSGGKLDRICKQLDKGWTWKYHSTLNRNRFGASVVSTSKTTFIFGGYDFNNGSTFEYLAKDSFTWVLGKTDIPNGFRNGAAIAVKSEKEIWLIGGHNNKKRILCFNVEDHTFEELPFKLNIGRKLHKCAYIPGTKKVMIAGGFNHENKYLNSTEVLDPEDESIILTSPMNYKRSDFGIGVVTIKGEDKLAVVGGTNRGKFLRNVEIFDEKTQKWKKTHLKLDKEKQCHQPSFLSVKLGILYDTYSSESKHLK